MRERVDNWKLVAYRHGAFHKEWALSGLDILTLATMLDLPPSRLGYGIVKVGEEQKPRLEALVHIKLDIAECEYFLERLPVINEPH